MKVFKVILKLLAWLSALFVVGFVGFKVYDMVQREYILPTKYESLVERYSEQYGLPEALVYAVIKTESGFDPQAESSAGARGLMQMLPSTYEFLWGQYDETHGEDETCNPLDLFVPEISIRYGCKYLASLKAAYGGWTEVLAAYNAGQGNVAKWLSDPAYATDGRLTEIPYAETREYVERVKENAEKYQKLYGEEKEWKQYE